MSYNKKRFCVLGIGDGGTNTVELIAKENFCNFDLFSINTNRQDQYKTNYIHQINLNFNVKRGNKTFSEVDYAQYAVIANRDLIIQALEPYDIVVMSTFLGGNTGTGATPEIVRLLKKRTNQFIICLVTKPLCIEGRTQWRFANYTINKLKKLDAQTIIFNNDNLLNYDKIIFHLYDQGFKIINNAHIEVIKYISYLLQTIEKIYYMNI